MELVCGGDHVLVSLPVECVEEARDELVRVLLERDLVCFCVDDFGYVVLYCVGCFECVVLFVVDECCCVVECFEYFFVCCVWLCLM